MRNLTLSVFAAFLASQLSFAAVSTQDEKKTSFADQFGIDYWSAFGGGPLSDPFTDRKPTPAGEIGSGVDWWQELTFSYKFGQGFKAYGVLGTYWVLGGDESSFSLGDTEIGLKKSTIYKKDGFKFGAKVYTKVPTSERSQDQSLSFAPGSKQYLTYKFNQSRFSLGMETNFRGYVYGEDDVEPGDSRRKFMAEAMPWVAYQLSPAVKLELEYTMKSANFRDSARFTEFYRDGSNLQTNLHWSVTPDFTATGYLLNYPGDKISLEATQIGFELWARVF